MMHADKRTPGADPIQSAQKPFDLTVFTQQPFDEFGQELLKLPRRLIVRRIANIG
jgi:hypothetical protein